MKDQKTAKKTEDISVSELSSVDSLRSEPVNTKQLLRMFIIVAVLLILTGLITLFTRSSSNLELKSLINGKYTYSFSFYKPATLIHTSTGDAYKYLNSAIAGLQLTSEPIVTSCSQIGSGWVEVFNVNVYGSQRPICMANASNVQIYVMNFSALNARHLFEITYNNSPQTSPYTILKDIFGSVKVKH